MATTKKDNNTMAKEVVEAADKAAKEAQEVVDVMIEIGNKAFANAKPMMDTQQQIWEDSFATWQDASNGYLAFVTRATQQVFEQSMTFQNEMLAIAESNTKQTQELYAAQQAMILDSVEAYQTQLQATSERLVKIFTPVFPIK